jgi:hypothetical protein
MGRLEQRELVRLTRHEANRRAAEHEIGPGVFDAYAVIEAERIAAGGVPVRSLCGIGNRLAFKNLRIREAVG